ncbi:MAG: hypothetical protein R2762_27255 [Bryobacteraceae bacterium]
MQLLLPPLVFILLSATVLPAAAAPVIQAAEVRPVPAWARLERELIALLDRAGELFVETYAQPDGTLRFKQRYEGGMNSSDDAYEAFRSLSIHTIVGGSARLDAHHRRVWDGITRQFTRYGQIWREFDSNWDWMHHGEGYTSFYSFGLADPGDAKFRDRAVRFARMYTGDDEESPNYDRERNLIRAVMNGSRGPKMAWTTRDWIPTNANLTYYQLPYDDIPGVDSPAGWINDESFAQIVKTMSDRMARGDVPINLTVTPLIANAYLYTGDAKYKDWVARYIEGWQERTRANNGITPDNVGATGKVGENTGGKWWGGYYGWRWPRGGIDIIRAEITAAKAAHLLTGDVRWFDLPRSQLEVVRKQGRQTANGWRTPARHDDRGWYQYGPEPAYPYAWMWLHTFDERDWKEAERLGARGNEPDVAWALFLRGRDAAYPEAALRRDLQQARAKMDRIRGEHGDPETWVDSKWADMNPMTVDNLLRLTMGAPQIDLRGEMLHARLRYFDAANRRPGLPAGVAALVTKLGREEAAVELVNTSPASRRVLVQGGAYGEHRFESVNGTPVGGKTFEVAMAPGAGITLSLRMKCWVNTPSFAWPPEVAP